VDKDPWPNDDPELRDPTTGRPPAHEPSDVGADTWRDYGDGPPPAWRDAPPDLLGPIDPEAPVSGHQPAPESTTSIAESPEHDWEAASKLLYPLLRPVGTPGVPIAHVDPRALADEGMKSHAQPLIAEGPGELVVVYAISSGRFDVIVNADHLLSWGVAVDAIEEAARSNLAGWSASAAWSDETSDRRRLLSSQTGEGWDASRILLPDVRERLASELGGAGRVLVGLPERHLLVAGALTAEDPDYATLLSDFVIEQSGQADEPIDRRLFELVEGRLEPFRG
jgi:hypothetical protein